MFSVVNVKCFLKEVSNFQQFCNGRQDLHAACECFICTISVYHTVDSPRQIRCMFDIAALVFILQILVR